MIRPDDLTEAGRFGQPHALKGEINLFPDDAPPSPGDFLFVDIDSTMIPFEVRAIRRRGEGAWLVTLADCSSADDVALLRNCPYMVPDQTASGNDSGNEEEGFYASDLVGFFVFDSKTGEIVGTVSDYDDSTMNTLLIVTTPSGRELYIPFAEAYIDAVDPETSAITVSLPEGFEQLND
ncbi:MAG: ribosome maturation factor RimM [Clostridium sp.]|nr:ribosome maturation factor RimM [Clostridium sp.]